MAAGQQSWGKKAVSDLWKGVMAMRDIIVHHYFEVDAEVVFETVRKDLPLLKKVLEEMRRDVMFG